MDNSFRLRLLDGAQFLLTLTYTFNYVSFFFPNKDGLKHVAGVND